MYREHAAGPRLAPVVECFWTSTLGAGGPLPAAGRVLPDGCMDLLFDFVGEQRPRTSVIGTMTRAVVVTPTPQVDLMGVRFRPGGLGVVFPCEASAVTDRSEEAGLDAVWQRLGEARRGERLSLLRAWLERRVAGEMDPFVRHCAGRVEAARGDLRMAALVASTGLSARQLERKFARHVGVTPKTFARVMRFRALLRESAGAARPDWARLAAEFGYADQPHLVREFKLLAGVTPAAWRDVGNLQDPDEAESVA